SNRLTFKNETFRDRRLTDRVEGGATRRKEGGLALDIRRPKKTSAIDVRDVLFPVAHSIALMQAASRGETVFSAPLYDGGEKGEKLHNTTAIIGALLKDEARPVLPEADGADVLADLGAWPVSLSYFDAAKGEDADNVPDYELGFLMYENGVSRKLTIDYGTFAITGRLSKLEMLDVPACANSQ
ncbi:MAG: DUF1849 family protein, partial [Pseudomonadota bacterium]